MENIEIIESDKSKKIVLMSREKHEKAVNKHNDNSWKISGGYSLGYRKQSRPVPTSPMDASERREHLHEGENVHPKGRTYTRRIEHFLFTKRREYLDKRNNVYPKEW